MRARRAERRAARPRVSVATVLAEALETSHATVEAAQGIVEAIMGAGAPQAMQGDTVVDVLERASKFEYNHEALLVAPGEWPTAAEAKEANAAEQKYITVKTKAGATRTIHQPKGAKQVERSPDRDAWLESDRAAWEKLKLIPGNRMIRADQVPEGAPLYDCVTARVVKTDPATQELVKLSSRHNVDGNRGRVVNEQMGIDWDVPESSPQACDMVVKMMISDAKGRRRSMTKADVTTAYQNGKTKRGVRCLKCPQTCQEYDDDGTPMVMLLGPPLFGEPAAGREWYDTLAEALRDFGMREAENVPCLWTYTDETGDLLLSTIVDDLLMTEGGRRYDITDRLLAHLRRVFKTGVTAEREPTAYAGYKLTHSEGGDACKMSMPELIEQKVRDHLPEVLVPGALGPFIKERAKAAKQHFDKLQMPAERPAKLSKDSKKAQQIIGDIRYMLKAMAGRLNVPAHRLSCVMSSPPPEALPCAEYALAIAYRHRHDGITYSYGAKQVRIEFDMGTGFPSTEAFLMATDATWGDRNLIGILGMMNGGAVVDTTKKTILADSSWEVEGIGASKGAEVVALSREVERAFGIAQEGPTKILTDNLSTMRVANNIKSSTRAMHALRRYNVLQQRVAAGECKLEWVPDAQNPADYLTKWLGAGKFEKSVAYAAGAEARHKYFGESWS